MSRLEEAPTDAPNRFYEAFPQIGIDRLAAANIQQFYIPSGQGGELFSLTQLVWLWRQLANEDLTLAIAHGKTFLGSVCSWIAGDARQKAMIAKWVSDDQPMAWGLTERDRGADIMSTQTRAEIIPTGWCISGEKWLINNATRSRAITVLARTSDGQGARNLSLFIVDKAILKAEQYTPCAKIQTHGIRGADISGIRLNRAELPADALLGDIGTGFETTLKALQLTRVACCGLSLGALDGAIATTARFAQEHRLYGRALIELDTVKEVLTNAVATLWFSEITTWTAARVADRMPEELSVVSALTKASIPSHIAHQMGNLEEQMGARGFICDLPNAEQLEKRIRDHQIVPIFDGSTLVCRASLTPQISTLVRKFRSKTYDTIGLANLFSAEPNDLTFDRLELLSRGGCSLVQSIPETVALLRSASEDVEIHAELDAFQTEANRVLDDLAQASLRHPDVPFKTLQSIQAYEWLFIGACCLQFQVWRKTQNDKPTDFPYWFALCLNTINKALRRDAGLEHPDCKARTYFKDWLFTRSDMTTVSLIQHAYGSRLDD